MTKFVSAKVIRNKETLTVAQAFEEEILNRHWCPFEVTTDRGTEFNPEFAERLQKAGAKHIRVSPRDSKANGQVEKMMKMIKLLCVLCVVRIRGNGKTKWQESCQNITPHITV
jgi:hypothetical protein